MKTKEVLESINAVSGQMEPEDKSYMNDLAARIRSGAKVTNADDYIDLLLGYAEESDDEVQEMIYALVDYITEKYA